MRWKIRRSDVSVFFSHFVSESACLLTVICSFFHVRGFKWKMNQLLPLYVRRKDEECVCLTV